MRRPSRPCQTPVLKPPAVCGAFFEGWGRPSIHTVCGAIDGAGHVQGDDAPEIGSTSGSMRRFCGPMTMYCEV